MENFPSIQRELPGSRPYKNTCFHNKGKSARLDYFLISPELLQCSIKTQMLLGEWYPSASDHVRLTCKVRLSSAFIPPATPRRIVAIHKPNVSMLPPEGKTLLRATINHQLQELEKETKESQKTGSLSIEEANQLSIRTAILIVEAALGTRCKRVEKTGGITVHFTPERKTTNNKRNMRSHSPDTRYEHRQCRKCRTAHRIRHPSRPSLSL